MPYLRLKDKERGFSEVKSMIMLFLEKGKIRVRTFLTPTKNPADDNRNENIQIEKTEKQGLEQLWTDNEDLGIHKRKRDEKDAMREVCDGKLGTKDELANPGVKRVKMGEDKSLEHVYGPKEKERREETCSTWRGSVHLSTLMPESWRDFVPLKDFVPLRRPAGADYWAEPWHRELNR